MGEEKYCKNCGAKLRENDKFCTNCGAAVDDMNESVNEEKFNQSDTVNAFDHNEEIAEETTGNPDGPGGNTEGYAEKPYETTENPERPKSNTSRNVLIAVAAVVCCVIAFGAGYYFGNHNMSAENLTSESQGNSEEEEETTEEEDWDDIMADPEQSDPRSFVAYVYSQIVNKNLSGQECWDKYVSEESGSYVIESEYVNCFDNAQKYSKTIGYLSINYQETDDNGDDGENKEEYRVLGTVQNLSSSDELTTTQTYDYVVVEDGKYKLDVTNHLDSIFNF